MVLWCFGSDLPSTPPRLGAGWTGLDRAAAELNVVSGPAEPGVAESYGGKYTSNYKLSPTKVQVQRRIYY